MSNPPNSAFGVVLPDWLKEKLVKEAKDPHNIEVNDIMKILLQDYIRRHTYALPKKGKEKCKLCSGKGRYEAVVPPGKTIKVPCNCKKGTYENPKT